MRKWMWIVVGAVAACGDSRPPLSDAGSQPDRPSDAPADTPVVATTAITVVDLDPAPIYLAVKDGDAAWQKLDLATKPVVLHVHDRYQLLAVCAGQSAFDLGIAARVVADGATVTPTCLGAPPVSTAGQIAITGAMKQAGRLTIGRGKSKGTSPEWPFQITTTVGKHHLIAISTDNRVLVQHAVDLEESTTLPEIDVASGDDMVTHAFAVTNGNPAGELSNILQVTSALDGFLTLGGDTTNVAHVLPKAQAGGDFVQRVVVSADTETT